MFAEAGAETAPGVEAGTSPLRLRERCFCILGDCRGLGHQPWRWARNCRLAHASSECAAWSRPALTCLAYLPGMLCLPRATEFLSPRIPGSLPQPVELFLSYKSLCHIWVEGRS